MVESRCRGAGYQPRTPNGSEKVVQVIRLVAQGTVEDKMYELQQKKKNMIDQVIQPGQETLSALTELEIRELLMI